MKNNPVFFSWLRVFYGQLRVFYAITQITGGYAPKVNKSQHKANKH